jgi:hypothetical protein
LVKGYSGEKVNTKLNGNTEFSELHFMMVYTVKGIELRFLHKRGLNT